MKKNILITGGFGLLGQSLVRKLNKKYFKIYLLDKIKYKNKNRFLYKYHKNTNIIYGNFNDKKFISNLIVKKKIDIIFHTGAVTQVLESLKEPNETYQTNIFGTLNILESIKNYNKKIIFIYSSSDKAYGELRAKSYTEQHRIDSIYPYDLSKSCSDLICQSYSKIYGLKVGILRCGNLYGPGDFNFNRIVPETITRSILNKKLIIRSSGKLTRDYLYIDDAVDAYLLVMKKLLKVKKNELMIYNVGSKYNLSVIQIVNKILNLMKKTHLKPIIKNSSKMELKTQKLNYNKIIAELKWKQKINMEAGIKSTIYWYIKNFHHLKINSKKK
jgi:CDP-glucose 4,6-dehydratase